MEETNSGKHKRLPKYVFGTPVTHCDRAAEMQNADGPEIDRMLRNFGIFTHDLTIGTGGHDGN